jgi:hypothetical protein
MSVRQRSSWSTIGSRLRAFFSARSVRPPRVRRRETHHSKGRTAIGMTTPCQLGDEITRVRTNHVCANAQRRETADQVQQRPVGTVEFRVVREERHPHGFVILENGLESGAGMRRPQLV